MSTQVLPSLPGQGIEVTRTPLWSGLIQKALSGKETRLSLMSYPDYQFDITFNVARATAATSYEFQQLLDFFNSRQGQVDTFLYTDPDDNSTTGQQLGVGNGVTAQYQLLRKVVGGSFLEPILAPNTVSAVYLSGVSIPAAGYSAPGTPSLSTASGGSLTNTTYYVKVTWVTSSGETLPSAETNLAVTSGNLLKVTQPASPPTGAVSWNLYVSNTAGGGSGAEQLQATVAIGTTTWTEPATGLIAGLTVPTANTTGWSVSTWGATSPGMVTFAANVASSVPVTADFTFYWPCRMLEDKLAFSQFLPHYYKVKKFSFKSVKN